MGDNMKETLRMVFSKPGICTTKELVDAKHFILDLKDKLDLYVSVAGCVPEGYTLQMKLENISFYIDRINNMTDAERDTLVIWRKEHGED